ncbi:MAG: GNAT family N-acetyltransferase [Planctomycetota bacterium]
MIDSSHAGTEPQGLRIARVDPAQRAVALGVLLKGKPDPDEPSVQAFLDFARAHKVPLDDLWAACDASRPDRPLAAALLAPSPGRTAMLFVSPIREPAGVARAAELIDTLVAGRLDRRVRVVQALLDVGQTEEQQALVDGGFIRLARLAYLQRPCPSVRRVDPLAPALARRLDGRTPEVFAYTPEMAPKFERAILASYRGTQDCPGLLGLRPIDEVLEGHRASGVHRPDLWFAVYDRDEPVAVLLINQSHQSTGFELVYLGVADTARGKGLGRALLEHGLAESGRQGAGSMVLAVDERNDPAVRLYRSMGFAARTRKVAMIRPTESAGQGG